MQMKINGIYSRYNRIYTTLKRHVVYEYNILCLEGEKRVRSQHTFG